MTDQWPSKYFSRKELACKCGRPSCDAPPVSHSFLKKLDMVRERWGRPLSPMSGSRCKVHNDNVGGAPQSRHLFSDAADFWIPDHKDRDRLVAIAKEVGMTGIGWGVKGGKVHIDDRPLLAGTLGPITWRYT